MLHYGTPSTSIFGILVLLGVAGALEDKFFNIKPAVKVLCFSLPHGRARQELVIRFKEW